MVPVTKWFALLIKQMYFIRLEWCFSKHRSIIGRYQDPRNDRQRALRYGVILVCAYSAVVTIFSPYQH